MTPRLKNERHITVPPGHLFGVGFTEGVWTIFCNPWGNYSGCGILLLKVLQDPSLDQGGQSPPRDAHGHDFLLLHMQNLAMIRPGRLTREPPGTFLHCFYLKGYAPFPSGQSKDCCLQKILMEEEGGGLFGTLTSLSLSFEVILFRYARNL